jgi:hypothetical protein
MDDLLVALRLLFGNLGSILAPVLVAKLDAMKISIRYGRLARWSMQLSRRGSVGFALIFQIMGAILSEMKSIGVDI